MKTVTNPYPKWQDTGMNCWNCYRLLWFKADCDKHLCPNCQAAGIQAEPAQEATG